MSEKLATYNPYDVPPVKDESRFALGVTPAGWAVASEGEAVAGVYGALVADRVADAGAYRVPPVEVKLRAIVITDGGYRLADRGVVGGVPEFEARRPGKRWRRLTGPALLDSLFLGTEAYANAPDLEVWEAALATAERYNLRGDTVRSLNNSLALLVSLRAGLRVRPSELPNIGGVLADGADGE